MTCANGGWDSGPGRLLTRKRSQVQNPALPDVGGNGLGRGPWGQARGAAPWRTCRSAAWTPPVHGSPCRRGSPEDSAADRLDGQVVGTDRRAVFQEVLRDGPVGCVGCGYLLVVSGVAVKRANASSKLSWKVLLRAAGCGVRSRWWYQ